MLPGPHDRGRSRGVPPRCMSFLLDTCVVLWAAREPKRLSLRVRDLLLDTREELVLSVVSAWEISLKPELAIADAANWLEQAAGKHCRRAFSPSALSTSPPCRSCPHGIAIRLIACSLHRL